MSEEIVAWYVARWSEKPERRVFAKETDHFYVPSRGRREKKVTDWYSYYPTESEAVAVIKARKESEEANRQAGRIRDIAPELYKHADALLADVMQRYGITEDGLTCPHMRGLAEALRKARGA